MNFAWDFGGAAPILLKAKISATFATPGLYATVTTDGVAGVVVGLRTTITTQVGVAIDTGTYSATPTTEGVVTLITNPLAVYKMRMVDGNVGGGALRTITNTAASTTIVTITTGDPVPNSPEMDEGSIVCVSGANLGQIRKITGTAATTATAVVAFLNTCAVGDQFIVVPWTPFDTVGDNIGLDYRILDADRNVAVGTGADLRPLVLEFDTSSVANAQQNSYVYGVLVGHVLTQGT